MSKKKEVKPMPLIKVKDHYQVTIPSQLRKKFNLAIGDYMEAEERNGEIVLKPVKMVHPDQAYFYSEEWQKGEAEADKDLAQGNTLGPFDNLADGLTTLKTAKI